ncbi:MAG: hypothetical protein M3277_01995 [Actinomycetota bacterium]|nr:hypothetical protein [Actinomycetota bacterium]
MTSRAGSWIAWSVAAIAAAALVVGWTLDQALRNRDLPSQEADPATGVAFAAMALLGVFLAHKRPDNGLGWLFLGVGAVAGLSLVTPNYALYSVHVQELPGTALIGWFSAWLWLPTIGSVMTFFFLLFPTGHVPGPRWRWVFRMAVAAIVGLCLAMALKPGRLGEEELPIVNPFGVEGLGPILDVVGASAGILFAAATVASLVSLVFRFRRGSQIERLQIKWFAFAAGINVTSILIEILFPAVFAALPRFVDDTVFGMQVLLLPVTAALAILRYRLYEIDVIINRALVYAALTAVLLGSYLVIVLTLSRLLDPVTRDSDVAVAASTLAVAALFRPLRARIQAFIDRRFYRAKYDAVAALDRFGARLRDEVDIELVRSDVLGLVADTMQPSHASLWLRREGAEAR